MYCQTVVSGFRKARRASRLAGDGVLPIGPDRVPAVAQPFLIGVAVLRDDRGDPLRMPHREPEAGRRAVVEDVEGEAVEADDLGEAVDRVREPVESVAAVRHVGVAEARQIGRDDVEAVGQQRDQVAEHVARAREAVQQQQLRRIRRARLAIEDLEAVHVGGAIGDGGHGAFPLPGITFVTIMQWLRTGSRTVELRGYAGSRPGPLRSPRG